MLKRLSLLSIIILTLSALPFGVVADIDFPVGSVTYPASGFQYLMANFASLVQVPGALGGQAGRLIADPNSAWAIQVPINGCSLKNGCEYKLYAVARVKFISKPAGDTFGVGLYDNITRQPVFGARMWTVEESSSDWKLYECGTWIPDSHVQTAWVVADNGAIENVDIDRFVIVPQSSQVFDTVGSYLSANSGELAVVVRGGEYGFSSIELADARSLNINLIGGNFDPLQWPDSWAGIVIDYHTPAGYSRRVNFAWGSGWRGKPAIRGEAVESIPQDVRDALAAKSRARNTFTPVSIANQAPSDWDGRVKLGVLVQGLDTDKGILALNIPGKTLADLPILGVSHDDSKDCATDFGGVLGYTDAQLEQAINAQYRAILERKISDTSNGKVPAYVLRTESPQCFVFKDRLNESWINSSYRCQPIEIKLAKQEYESTQVVVIPTGKNAINDVTVSASNLVGNKGTIKSSDISIWRVDYVNNPQPGGGQKPGLYPDPLMPNASFDVPAGENRAVWMTVHTESDTPAGIYHGKLTVRSADADSVDVPVTVTVWNFTVPKRNHLKTAFWFSPGQAEHFYNYPDGLPEVLQNKFVDFLNEYRVGMDFPGVPDHMDGNNRGFKMYKEANGTYTFDFTDMDRLLTRCFAAGQSAFNIALSASANTPWDRMSIIDRKTGKSTIYTFRGYDDPTFWPIYEAFLKSITQHMKAKGWWKYCYYQGNDEPGAGRPGSYEATCKLYDFVHKVIPDMKCLITKQPVSELDGHIDIWCPLDMYFEPSVSKQRQAAGQEMWWYFISRFDHSRPLMDLRMSFWTTWKYHLSGLLYWSSDWWCAQAGNVQTDPTKRWPNSPWILTGDDSGQLFYPGPNGPLPSQRLESIRDGFEDYEYLHLLSEKLAKLKAHGIKPAWAAEADRLLAVPGDIVQDKDNNTRDYSKVQKTRAKIAQMILSKH